jgi:hypothetical protein
MAVSATFLSLAIIEPKTGFYNQKTIIESKTGFYNQKAIIEPKTEFYNQKAIIEPAVAILFSQACLRLPTARRALKIKHIEINSRKM